MKDGKIEQKGKKNILGGPDEAVYRTLMEGKGCRTVQDERLWDGGAAAGESRATLFCLTILSCLFSLHSASHDLRIS